MRDFDGDVVSSARRRPPAPDDHEPGRARVVLAGVVLMIGVAVCVLMAVVTATHHGRPFVLMAVVPATHHGRPFVPGEPVAQAR